MQRKFNRDYRITVDTVNANSSAPLAAGQGKSVEIGPPFAVEFDLVQNTLASQRTLDLTIYNLSLATRSQLRRDRIPMDRSGDVSDRQIEFWAGYEGSVPSNLQQYYQSTAQANTARSQAKNFPTVFRGVVVQAYSKREGPNVITRIEAKDIGTSKIPAHTNRSYAKGTPYTRIIQDLISDIPRVSVGAIGNFPKTLDKGTAVTGDPIEQLLVYTDGHFFIYQQKAYCLNDTEYLKGSIPKINAASGLIGTPQINSTIVTATLLFEPGLVLAQGIELESITAPSFNSFYKIIGISHRGVISPTVCGTATTTVEMTNYASITNSVFTLVSP